MIFVIEHKKRSRRWPCFTFYFECGIHNPLASPNGCQNYRHVPSLSCHSCFRVEQKTDNRKDRMLFNYQMERPDVKEKQRWDKGGLLVVLCEEICFFSEKALLRTASQCKWRSKKEKAKYPLQCKIPQLLYIHSMV